MQSHCIAVVVVVLVPPFSRLALPGKKNVVVFLSLAVDPCLHSPATSRYMLNYFNFKGEFADESYVMSIYFASSGIGKKKITFADCWSIDGKARLVFG